MATDRPLKVLPAIEAAKFIADVEDWAVPVIELQLQGTYDMRLIIDSHGRCKFQFRPPFLTHQKRRV